jgi:uncharacterized protein HemY
MNKLLFTTAMVLMMGGLKAQSLAEARKLMYYERYDGAAHQLHFLLQGNIASSEAWWLLTQIYIHQKHIAALRDTLSKMPTDAREQPLGIVACGQLLLGEHHKDSAMDYFNRALKMTKEKDKSQSYQSRSFQLGPGTLHGEGICRRRQCIRCL